MKRCPNPYKQAHASAEEARRHADALRRHNSGARDVAPYRCQCGAWHVGQSQERRQKRMGRAS